MINDEVLHWLLTVTLGERRVPAQRVVDLVADECFYPWSAIKMMGMKTAPSS